MGPIQRGKPIKGTGGQMQWLSGIKPTFCVGGSVRVRKELHSLRCSSILLISQLLTHFFASFNLERLYVKQVVLFISKGIMVVVGGGFYLGEDCTV